MGRNRNKTVFTFNFFLIVLVLVSLSSLACKQKTTEAKTGNLNINPQKEIVLEGLKRPWSMVFISDHEALLSEKDGDILRVNLSTRERTVINGFPNDLADSLVIYAKDYPLGTYPKDANGFKGKYNAGILDIVLDPDYDSSQWIYISYVAEQNKKYAIKVIRAKIQNNDLTEIEVILDHFPYGDGLFHFGGGLCFGADKKLYITAGERLFSERLEPDIPVAQNMEDTRGKIFRLNPDGSIPTDNPNIGNGTVKGLYATGIRAAQGLCLQKETGQIWFSEHGTMQGDELNVLVKGANYGWPNITSGGYRDNNYEPPSLDRDYKDPIWYWHKTIAPTGLTFYDGVEFPTWKGNLIVPGLSRGNLWRIVLDGQVVQSIEELFINDRQRTRKAVQSPDGQLYILTDENNGKIIRIKND